jgi:hypothetical protein
MPNYIKVIWTPAHLGIPRNELADKLEKSGSDPANQLCKHTCTTRTWLYQNARQQLIVEWSRDQGVTRSFQGFPPHLRNTSLYRAHALGTNGGKWSTTQKDR